MVVEHTTDEAARPLWRSPFVVTGAIGAAMICASVGVSTRRTVRAADVLARGQGELLFDSVAERIRQHGTERAALEDLLRSHRELGLVHVRLGDAVVIGESNTAPDVHKLTRELTVRSPRPAGEAGAGPPGPSAPSSIREPGFGRMPPGAQGTLSIAYVPSAATAARREAFVALGVALAAALGIVVLSVLFARAEGRRTVMRKEIARQRLLASLGQMSGIIAHELRNPLGALKGHAQLLVEDLDDLKVDASRAERLVTDAVRMEGLVNDLLVFMRSGELRLQTRPLVGVVREATSRVSEARVELDVRLDDDAPIPLDASRLATATENLVRNAAAAGSGWVGVSVFRDGAHAVVRVSDDGPGVDQALRDRIFEPFVTTKTRGTGLGLTLCARVVEAHGGSLTVEDGDAKGAHFVMRLPMATDRPTEEDSWPESS